MKLQINSLSFKISLTVALVTLIFGGFTLWAIFNFSLREFSSIKKTDAIQAVSYTTKILEEVLQESQRSVLSVAGDKMVVDFVTSKNTKNPQKINEQLNNYNPKLRYSAIYLIDINGIVIASTDASFMKQDYGFREYFIKSKNGEAYSDVNLGITSKQLGYYFSYPVLNEKLEVVGVAVIKMNSEIIMEILANILEKPMSDLLMTDKYGVVINSDRGERLYQSIGRLSVNQNNLINSENKYLGIEIVALQYESVMKLIRENIREIKVVDEFDIEDNDYETLVVSPILNNNFYLVGEISMGEVNSQAVNVSKLISMMILLSVFSSTSLVVLLLSRMLKSIGLLTTMAKEISNGKFNQNNPVQGGGEIEILGSSMVMMANEINEKYSDMDKLVNERTAKIESQKEILEKSKLAIMNILDDVALSKVDLEKFKLAVDGVSDHIVITDKEGIILYANKAVEKITGFSNLEVVGKKAGNKDLWGGLMPKIFYEQMWKTIKTDKKVFSGEVSNKRKNGEKYISIASISPILDQKGSVMFFVGIERDITHEKEIDKMKTDFISLASHQLRTPLSAMRWFSEMLLSGDAGKLNKEQTEFVKNIEQVNLRMTDLINSLLNISRIESGKIVIDPELVDLKKIFEIELAELDNQLKDKKQTVKIEIEKDLPKVFVDAKLISEVCKNLLTNAIKYSLLSGTINVEIYKKEKDVVFKISDKGIGIPKISQSKIFERFYRAENALKTETEGTGLGLYLVKTVIESSGGKVWFESVENKGSSFYFSLPLLEAKKEIVNNVIIKKK
jgi:PAS domain S-box-containing protein